MLRRKHPSAFWTGVYGVLAAACYAQGAEQRMTASRRTFHCLKKNYQERAMSDILSVLAMADAPVLCGVLSLVGAFCYSLYYLCRQGR